jgi:hypothetical protein
MFGGFWNFVLGGALCALAGAISFAVHKRWPNSTTVAVLSWAGFFVAFGLAIFYFGS